MPLATMSPLPVRHLHGPVAACVVAACLLLITGCDSTLSDTGSNAEGSGEFDVSCSIDESRLMDGGVPPDGIPALQNPEVVAPEQADYLADTDRVIGLLVDGEAYAVPHNILWHHEIINADFDDTDLAITYCPLTGSSMAFDRAVADGAEFGVSGLLFENNLVMYDRSSEESLWPQINRSAGCGPLDGRSLSMYPVFEMTWEGWRSLHPDTDVVSDNTGHTRDYTENGYPYGDYEALDNDRRELVQLLPEVGWRLGPGTLTAGARVPVAGRNFPSGPAVTVGYLLSWDEPLW